MRQLRSIISLTLLSLVAACSGETGNAGNNTGGFGFDVAGDVAVLDVGGNDTGAGTDTTTGGDATATDAGGDDTGGADTAGTDTGGDDGVSTDTAGDSTAGTCPGSAGCDCKDNGDCDSGICIDNANSANASGKECAQTCVDSCEAGYKCATTSIGGEPVAICVPAKGNLCHPCSASKDCEAVGQTDAACIDQGGLGSFCGIGCATDADCPETYACADTKSTEGATSKQCVKKPEAGSTDGFGVCDCSALASKKKLETACTVPALDDQGNTVGTCVGVRTCTEKGLSKCTSPEVGKEACDGIDNDCDGKTDNDACDDGNPCTIDACDPFAKACKTAPVTDGLDCDADGNACTSGDQCLGGGCVAGSKLDCDDKNPCTEDSCDPAKGCVQTPLDAVACDDDNPCSIGDVCKEGSCAPGTPKICESGDDCIIAKCSLTEDGKCKYSNALEGLPCDDGNACTEKDGCKDGSCTAGAVADCDDGNPCTSNNCDGKKGCTAENNNKPCDADGNACTVGDACVGGTCTAGSATGCDDGNPCTVDSCDAKSGKCAYEGSSTAPCNDDDVCTENDACAAGKCSGSKKNCDDGNACTNDLCDPKQGCTSVSQSAGCDDGDACTENDACSGNLCKGSSKNCDDNDPCTTDTCDPKSGCKHATAADQALCGVGKWCMKGQCVASCAADCQTAGETSCEGDAVITCGQSDADVCLDWSAPKACASFETCKAGTCVQKDAPANVVINEVLYDADGVDNDVFVELYGPAGTDLTGWTVVGVDGNSGNAYNAIDLKGKIPADGYFVIAGSKAGTWISDVADQTASQADYQNGPDNIQLLYGTKVVDAVGYGVFASAQFEGEGQPAPDPIGGSSIGRDAKSTDSDDNGKDFVAFAKPTPGAVNVVPNEPPTVGLKCPTTVGVGDKVKLDTTGTADSDGQIVSCSALVDGVEKAKAQTCDNLEVTLDKAGTPNVKVIAIDDKGADASASCTINVSATNKPPVVSLSCPSTVEIGKAANFDASKSTDADGKIASFTWTWGDGTAAATGTSALANHTFDKAGSFEVSVEAKDDKGATAKGSCLVQAKAANKAPTAKLACPGSVVVNTKATIDASGSTDEDGSIKSYTFVFSDGSPNATGSATTVDRTFSKTGTVTVTLTVVDDAGAEGKTSCSIPVSNANPPEVVIVKPSSDGNVTQGESVSFIVDATGKGGNSISKVTLNVDGAPIGTDTTAPYTFTWKVPDNAKTGLKAAIVATATDSAGGVGSSTARTLTIVNDPPKAAFSAVVSGALEVAVDGSLSSDTETQTADLEVRWDWENDGTWDVDWGKTKALKHKYAKAGSYTIAMEVRDAVGQISKTTRKVDLSLLQTVFGNVTTTTWVGTVIVTGNVIVPAGNTLTISPGTSVQFAVVDQNNDGKGDYSITVQGNIVVQGTEEEPVVFTHYGPAPAKGKGWHKLLITGDGSSFQHAVIEYADIGIETQKKVTLKNVVLRKNRVGIYAHADGQPEVTDSEVSGNIEDGISIGASGSIVWKGGKIASNGKSGLHAEASSASIGVQVDGALVEKNGYVGLEIVGGVNGLITHSNITGNAYEGVRLSWRASVDPTIAVRLNNIWGNATVGARVSKNVSISASKSGSTGSGTNSSAVYTMPAGTKVDLLRYNYVENDYYSSSYNYVTGYIRKDSTGGATILTASKAASTLLDVGSSNVTKLLTQVYRSTSSSSYSGTMNVSALVYDEKGAKREISVVRNAGESDVRWNWYGVFPSILPIVTSEPKTCANVQGFVGEKFDATWTRAPYYGGETAPADLSWSGTVWLTGDLTIASGKSLTIADGTTVEVVNHDQDANGQGDFDLIVNGTITAKGSAASPILFTSPGATGKVNQWQQLHVAGGTSKSDLAYVTVEYTNRGVQLGSGAHVLDHVTVRLSAQEGIRANNSTNVKLSAITLKENTGRGLWITSSSNVSVDGATITANGSHGVEISGSKTGISLAHAAVTKHKAAGVFAIDSNVSATYCALDYNDIGLRGRGTVGGSLKMSNIKYNNYEGILLITEGSQNPTMAVTQNNIFGNGIIEAGVVASTGWAVSKSGSTGSGTASSPVWSVEGGAKMLAISAGYSETDYYSSSYNYVTGYLRRDSTGGATIFTWSKSASTTWHDWHDANYTKLVGQVYRSTSSSSYNGTTSVPQVYYRKKDTGTEVSVLTTSGKLDMKGNYWGDGSFPNPVPKLALSRTDAVDVQGPQPFQINGTGPQK